MHPGCITAKWNMIWFYLYNCCVFIMLLPTLTGHGWLSTVMWLPSVTVHRPLMTWRLSTALQWQYLTVHRPMMIIADYRRFFFTIICWLSTVFMTIADCPPFFYSHCWLFIYCVNHCWLSHFLRWSFLTVCRSWRSLLTVRRSLISIADCRLPFDDHYWLFIVLLWSLLTVHRFVNHCPPFFAGHCWLPIARWRSLMTGYCPFMTIDEHSWFFDNHCWLSTILWCPLLTVERHLMPIVDFP